MAGRLHRRGQPFVDRRLAFLLVLCQAETDPPVAFGGCTRSWRKPLDAGASLSNGSG